MGQDVTPPAAAASGAAVDVSDRAGRALGVVASITAPVDVSDRAGRALGAVSVTGTPGVDVSDRAGRALGAASITGTVDVGDRAGRALGAVSVTGTPGVDVSDRAGRLLGIIASIAAAVDVSDRAGRLLGVVASIAAAVDVSDRAGRLLGVVSVSGTPNAPIADQGQATTAAAAAQTPTIAGAAGVTGYVTGFSIDGLGATAASVIEATLAGLIGGTKRYKLSIPAGVAVAITRLVVEFDTPIAATAANVAIVLTVPTFGAGNTSAVAEIHGFRR